MTYPPYGESSRPDQGPAQGPAQGPDQGPDRSWGQGQGNGQDPSAGYTGYSGQADYAAPSGYYGQSGVGQGGYGAQSSLPVQGGQFASGSARPGPPSNVGWAVASILFFWPLSFVAMTRAMDVYPLWAAGHHAEAEAASASAKKLGMISIAIVAVIIVLYCVLIFAMVGMAASGF